MKLFTVLALCLIAIHFSEAIRTDDKRREKRMVGAGILLDDDDENAEQQQLTTPNSNTDDNQLYWNCLEDRDCPNAKIVISNMSDEELIKQYKEKHFKNFRFLNEHQRRLLIDFQKEEFKKSAKENFDLVKSKFSDVKNKLKHH